ncbi:16S rRNA processing protein RimM [candidate division TA06 bacterium]|nr:16S rRNA processing protein RimM [candidate division TA06 bacterium]
MERDLIAIGMITKVHGTEGEVLVHPYTDELPSLLELNQVYLKGEEGRKVEVLQIRNDRRGVLLKLRGVEERETAQKMVGKTLGVERKDLPPLPSEIYFTFEVIGLKVVTESGENLGEIADVLKFPAQDVYLVKDGVKETLIPAIDTIVKKIDLEDRKMVISPMEGLF